MRLRMLVVICGLFGCAKSNSSLPALTSLPASRLYLEAHLPDGAKQLQPETIMSGVFSGATKRIYSNPSARGIDWAEEIIEKNDNILMYSQKIPLSFLHLAQSPQQLVQSFGTVIGAAYLVTHKVIDKEASADSPEAKIYPQFLDFAREELALVASGGSSSRIIGDSGMRVRAAPGCVMVDILTEQSYAALKASEVAAPGK